MRSTKQKKKTERIFIRVNPQEKSLLMKKASAQKEPLSTYIRQELLNNTKRHPSGNNSVITASVITAEIINHISEKYGDDEYLEKLSERLCILI